MNAFVKVSQEYFSASFLQFLLSIVRHFSAFFFRLLPMYPVFPFSIMSFGPCTLYAAMGSPHASDSSSTKPKVSVFEGKTKTSEIESKSTMSWPFL